MRKVFLLIAASFAFLSAFSASITQEQADEIVLERMSQEERLYFIYAKEGVQTKMTITTSAGEELELDYPCWVYYVSYADVNCICGRYLIVNESNGNLLDVNTKGKGSPKDLAQWRTVPMGIIKYVKTVLGGCNTDAGLRSVSDDSKKDEVIVSTTADSIHIFVKLNYYCGVLPFKTQCKIENNTIKIYITDICKNFEECYARCYCEYTFDFQFERKGEINYEYIVEFISPLEGLSKILSEGKIIRATSCAEIAIDYLYNECEDPVCEEYRNIWKEIFIEKNNFDQTSNRKFTMPSQDLHRQIYRSFVVGNLG